MKCVSTFLKIRSSNNFILYITYHIHILHQLVYKHTIKAELSSMFILNAAKVTKVLYPDVFQTPVSRGYLLSLNIFEYRGPLTYWGPRNVFFVPLFSLL